MENLTPNNTAAIVIDRNYQNTGRVIIAAETAEDAVTYAEQNLGTVLNTQDVTEFWQPEYEALGIPADYETVTLDVE